MPASFLNMGGEQKIVGGNELNQRFATPARASMEPRNAIVGDDGVAAVTLGSPDFPLKSKRMWPWSWIGRSTKKKPTHKTEDDLGCWSCGCGAAFGCRPRRSKRKLNGTGGNMRRKKGTPVRLSVLVGELGGSGAFGLP